MAPRVVPKWAALPASAPELHRLAWERAWGAAPPGRAGSNQTSASTTERIHRMLLALVADPDAPLELVGETLTAHVTEGRGAPDGVGPRGRLLFAALKRDLWRSSWIPACLTALQESDREFPREDKIDFTRELLSQARIPTELRPMVLAVSLLARPQPGSGNLREHLGRLLAAPDVDREAAGRLFKLLSKPGWFVVRPEGWRHHSELDESTRSSLRRSRPLHLPITAACVLAVDELRSRDSSLQEARPPARPRRVAQAKGGQDWVQPRLPQLDQS